MSSASEDSSICAAKRKQQRKSFSSEIWTQSSSDEQPEIPRGANRDVNRHGGFRHRNEAYTRPFWVPSTSNNNLYAESEAESYLKGDGVSTCSSLSTASSIEYGRGISAGNYKQNTTFTINPNFNMIKNKPKEKNMAEFGWGNVEDLEDPFWDRIRRQNRREEKYKYISEPSYEIKKEAPRLLKVRKQK
ncbi:unnamed protein product [Oikopleura dioica]|uniref:Uncharacterized protein n=1 Tax=Oikopleura dioica TaxID=34765 RepID=E4XA10_OIKDI|nr:unnamed protein product [Oikopleura dioica]